MTARLRRQLQMFAAIIAGGIFAGLLYNVANGLTRPIDLLVGTTYGVLISAPLGGLELLTSQGRGRSWLRRLPLPVSLALRSLVYAGVILTVQVGSLGHHLLGLVPDVGARDLRVTIFYSVGVALLFNIALELSVILGPRTLWRLLTGRYHAPREEARFVLIVDVAGSTAAAERLGNLASHRLLDQVFRLASGPVLETGGEIHSYVGDAMIVTWPAGAGRRPLDCFLAIRRVLAAAAGRLAAEFGIAPGVHGSLHFGEMVVGEIGDLKRSIVLQGDVMNAAARLEAASRAVAGGFIVSEAARAQMGAGVELVALGPLDLRGRQAAMQAWRLAG
jgi:adenylate cyclase